MSDNAPGWQADPTGKHDHRYWDGTQWTENVADAGVASLDPYEPVAPEPPAYQPPPVAEPEPEPEPEAAPPPVTSGGLFASQASYLTDEPAADDAPATDDGAAAAADEPVADAPDDLVHATDAADTGATGDTVVDQAPIAGFSEDYPATTESPAAWSFEGGAPDGAPAPPPPYVPEGSEGGTSRFSGLSSSLSSLGDGAQRGLLIGGGVLVAVLLLVVAMNVLGGDDDSPTMPIGSAGTTDTTDTTGPPKDGEYGSDPALDALYDACEDGDFASCDQLYLDSSSGSGYQTFGDTCGGRNEPSGYCVKVYADDGDDSAGATEDTLPDDFEQTMADTYASALGLEPKQAECLAGKFRDAIEQGTLQEDDAMTGVVDLLSECDISLEDFSSN
jgi:hypothetical protein